MTDIRISCDVWLSACLNFPCFNAVKMGGVRFGGLGFESQQAFVTAKATSEDYKMQRDLQAIGFVEINQQLTFRWRPVGTSKGLSSDRVKFKVGSCNDLGTTVEGFATLFDADRFLADKRLPRNWSAQIKKKWITSSDANKRILLATINNAAVGFVVFQLGDGPAVIDLIAVTPSMQGQGVGYHLLSHLQNIVCKGQAIVVGTQHDNLSAQRLYSASGFKLFEVKRVYHFYNEG